ncbi:MAG: hypothetical protein LBP68_00410, partial [Acidobacteriota bacterium]|nr:hypothetical protein [Acidobacteriota bacterium]
MSKNKNKKQPYQSSSGGDGWKSYNLKAELLEDTHPGSGSGAGVIDALVARDREGRPVIWASHLKGVFRDAARRLKLAGIDVDEVFGRVGGSRQRVLFTSLYTEDDRPSRIWRASARESFDNRAPKEETLRVIEYVPKGVCFEGRVKIQKKDWQDKAFETLCAEVSALGSGRAAGTGRVKLSLEKDSPNQKSIGASAGRLLLLLRNLDPVCVTATATPDNLIPGLAFIPGRAVLGAIVSWLLAKTENRGVADLLVNGELLVSDALPLPVHPASLVQTEILPAPLSLQSRKPEGVTGAVPWWARSYAAAEQFDSGNDDVDRKVLAKELSLKRPEFDLFVFRSRSDKPWCAFRPDLQVRLRNGRSNPRQDDPDLFAIEQIAEKTYFLCEVCGDTEKMKQLASSLVPILTGERWLRIGRGGAPVEIAKFEWARKFPETHIETKTTAILTLTSDLLVRDERLCWRTSLDTALLKTLLGLPTATQGDINLKKSTQEKEAIHGFNGTARLWRLPVFGIRRGSVFRVSGEELINTLKSKMKSGQWLGERTHEGFGRFRLDDKLPGTGEPVTGSSAVTTADDPGDTLAETTSDWFDSCKELASDGDAPSLSQWNDLVAELESN